LHYLEKNFTYLLLKIDEKSIDELGRWPWPRQTMAKLTKKLLEYEARVIAFDIIFSSPQSRPHQESLEQLNRLIPDALIENALKSRPKDGPSRIYRERCDNFILEPPAENWDGVFNLSTK